jgi:hypothetical protein
VKISELIDKLKIIQEQNEDLDVIFYENNFKSFSRVKLENITIEDINGIDMLAFTNKVI